MESILSNEQCCYICERTDRLHRHHVYPGIANRRLSEQYGCWVYLCPEHHNMSPRSVHFDRDLDLWLRRVCQIQFERSHTRDEFREIFGKSYL